MGCAKAEDERRKEEANENEEGLAGERFYPAV